MCPSVSGVTLRFGCAALALGIHGVGRLRPGVSIEQAQADMDRVSRDLTAAYPDSNRGVGAKLIPLKAGMIGRIRPILLVLLASGGICAADCLRERCQSAAGALDHTPARVRGPRCPGSHPGARGSATPHRKSLVGHRRRWTRSAVRRLGNRRGSRFAACSLAARGRKSGLDGHVLFFTG